jgi:hypothetical protein
MSAEHPTWPAVLRCLGRDTVRKFAVDQIRTRGFSADSFGLRANRELVAEALTRTEDWLELSHPQWPELEAIRVVRRALELELFR